MLVAEDDATMRRVLEMVLSERWTVQSVGDGERALEACLEQPPDVVLADLLMPGLDGFSLLRELRRDRRTRTVPVIVLSGMAEEEDRLKALEAGAADFLVKPFSHRELLLRVGTHIEMAELRREAARHEHDAQLHAILDGALDAVVGMDPEGRVAFWNPGAERVFGWKRDEAVGRDLADLIVPAELRADHRAGLARFLASGEGPILNQRVELSGVRRDGSTFPLELTVTAVRTGRSWTFNAFARDITDAKSAEVERRRLLEEAREANRLKDEFLATLSHELRTPLNAIVGWAHMLRAGGLDAATTTRAVETIDRNAQMQNQLIGDILDISRIVAGKLRLDLRSVDLGKVIEASLDTLRPQADAKKIRVIYAPDPSTGAVSGDPDRLQQVVWNLVSNAIKFTPEGGEVRVALGRAGGAAEITVQDSGPGISAEFLPHVFERFRQADGGSTRQKGGLGLGLAIVRHITEAHNGTVQAHSAGLGKGASFVVRIPVLGAAGAAEAGPVAPLSGETPADHAPILSGVRVLLVEDEDDSRDLVATVLRQGGAEVVAVSSAAAAMEALVRDRPDVLLSDIGLPGEDGYSLMRRVRALPAESGGRTPAAALTAYTRTEDRMQALLAGFQIHVPKPAQPVELVTVIASLADRRKLEPVV